MPRKTEKKTVVPQTELVALLERHGHGICIATILANTMQRAAAHALKHNDRIFAEAQRKLVCELSGRPYP